MLVKGPALNTHINYEGNNEDDNGYSQLLIMPWQNHPLHLQQAQSFVATSAVEDPGLTFFQKEKAMSGPTMSFSKSITAR